MPTCASAALFLLAGQRCSAQGRPGVGDGGRFVILCRDEQNVLGLQVCVYEGEVVQEGSGFEQLPAEGPHLQHLSSLSVPAVPVPKCRWMHVGSRTGPLHVCI